MDDEALENARKKRQNILLEGRLLRYYNRVYMTEMMVYGIAFGTIVYLGGAYLASHFNLKVANICFIYPGLTLSIGNFYFR